MHNKRKHTHTNCRIRQLTSPRSSLLHTTSTINKAILSHLGCSFSGVIKAGAAQEHVELFPGLASRLFHMQIALNLWTAARVQKVLENERTTTSIVNTAAGQGYDN